jgi:hypothetical protein
MVLCNASCIGAALELPACIHTLPVALAGLREADLRRLAVEVVVTLVATAPLDQVSWHTREASNADALTV